MTANHMDTGPHSATNIPSEGLASVFGGGGRGSFLFGIHATGGPSNADLESPFQLPAELEERLSCLAETTGKTKAFHTHEALLSYLEDLEDLVLAESRRRDIRSGNTQAIPLEDVLKQYGMEG